MWTVVALVSAAAAKLATGAVDSASVLDGSLNPQDLGVAARSRSPPARS